MTTAAEGAAVEQTLADAGQRLRHAAEPEWFTISDSVIAKLRATARHTTPVAASTSDLIPAHEPRRDGETTHVSDQVIRTHLNAAVTAAHLCAPADVVLTLAGDVFVAASVHVVGAYGTDLHGLGEQIRHTAITVLTELLGPQHPPLDIDQVDVRISDITHGDPRLT